MIKKGVVMCFIIAIAFFVAAYNFYEKGFETEAVMSPALALIILIFFTYRIIKNRRCFFGKERDCNKKSKLKVYLEQVFLYNTPEHNRLQALLRYRKSLWKRHTLQRSTYEVFLQRQ